MPSQKQPGRRFRAGDKIRVNLHHGKVEDAVVRAIIEHKDGLRLQIDFGNDQTALIGVGQGSKAGAEVRVRYSHCA